MSCVREANFECFQSASIRTAGGSHRRTPLAAQWIAATLACIRDHLTEPLHISTLCSIAGISAPRLHELFKRETGYTPINFLIRLRMQRARWLLENEDSSVKDVAARVGYNDPLYFLRRFKQVNGAAPGTLRARLLFGTRLAPRSASRNLAGRSTRARNKPRLPAGFGSVLPPGNSPGPQLEASPAEKSEGVRMVT